MNWEAYRFYDIRCKITPRTTWQGQPVKQGVRSHIGESAFLNVGWKMDKEDNYPGEYALIPADDATQELFRQMGITWIASGDVTPEAFFNVTV